MMVLSIFWLRILNILSQARLYPVRLIIHGKKPLSPLSHSLLPLRIKRRLGKDENSPGYLLTFSTSIFRERTPELYLPSQSTFQRFSNPKVSKKSKKIKLKRCWHLSVVLKLRLGVIYFHFQEQKFHWNSGRLSPSGQRLALKTTVMYACCCINCQFHG